MTETLSREDIDSYLERNQKKELLRFLTCGSVDDGKSTLIGRLLHDTKGIYEDQLAAVKRDSVKHGTTGAGEVDLALLTDGLKAEREQGITIDVAYRYFSTDKRKFIIADTPGHEQYTRNMATGASTCQLAIILIDARHGVMTQTRRHSFIVSLLGIKHVVVAVNKMDLVGYSKARYEEICAEYRGFARKLKGDMGSGGGDEKAVRDIVFVPMSALKGDNVVEKTGRGAMGWYDGPTLLEHLETVPLGSDWNLRELRFPVQYVLRPNLDFRGFAGTLASGVIKKGDEIVALPSGKKSKVKSIVVYQKELEEAFAPMAVAVTLTSEIDVSRGDMLAHAGGSLPEVGQEVEAMVVWMHERAMTPGKSYAMKQTTRTTSAEVTEILYGVDVNTLEQHAAERLGLNEVGKCVVRAGRPLVFDAYEKNRGTGAFILIDTLSNATVGAGMIVRKHVRGERASGPVTRKEKEVRLGQKGVVLWVTGGIAAELERRLFEAGRMVVTLDVTYENLEEGAAAGFARVLSGQGVMVIVHTEKGPGEKVREILGEGLVVVEEKDVAGAMKKLRAGGVVGAEEAVEGEGI